jgi:thiol-disulfide isomerase/thioredoxin
MRRLVFALIGLGLVAIVVIGVLQSKEATSSTPSTASIPSAAQARRALAGAPAALAALHRQAGTVVSGGAGAYDARLRALRGHPVVVNFWATWCGPCRIEFPVFQRESVALGKRVAFLGVDVQNARSDARSWLAQRPLSYPSYADDDRKIVGRLGAQGLPTTAFYSPSGALAYVHQGPYESDAALERDIRRYLHAA